MRHQPHRLRPLARFFRHSPVQFTDLRLQPVERFQQPLAPLGRVRQQRQLLQLCSPCLRPQLAFFLHPTTQSHGLQLILGARPRLHPSTSSGQALLVTMHQQLPHMPHLQARHPDPRKPILHQQLQQVLRVPPVRLLLAHHRSPHLRRIPIHSSMPNSSSNRSNHG